MEKDFDKTVERLLEAPFWVIDMLPMQVPKDCGGQFFAVEKYYLGEAQLGQLSRRFADLLLKLNCYYDLLTNRAPSDEWIKNPAPEALVDWLTNSMRNSHLCVLIETEDALITASAGDIYITLYNPSPALLELVQQLATASGLFVWQPK